MPGPFSTSPRPQEPRHRPAGTPDDAGQKKHDKDVNIKELGRRLIRDKASNCKLRSLQAVLVFITCATVFLITQSPAANVSEDSPSYSYRSRWTWDWDRPVADDPRYVSDLETNWAEIQTLLTKITATGDGLSRVGLLNFNATEVQCWKNILAPRAAEASVVRLRPVGAHITWEVLYPEWIDEEEESEVPICPKLSQPEVSKQNSGFDLIAVKLPCNKSAHWTRDVARLHLQLSAAKLAVAAGGRSGSTTHVVFVTGDCFPVPNLFRCKELVGREGGAWMYRPDLRFMKEKLRLPVGSCELAVPLKATARLYSDQVHREAYATILHSAEVYVCGAIAVAQSIRMSGSIRDMVILVDATISDHHRQGLSAAGWKVRTIERIRNPKAERNAYNEWNYSKFRLWQLTDYDRVIFIDADLLFLRNTDFLFTMPEISATGNNATMFNSGVMVVEPSNCTFQLLMDHIHEIESYNGGDQGYLNEVFTWWHRVPRHMNFLKHFWMGDNEQVKEMKTRMFGADPPVLYVLHYLGLKPWLCFRDYDCNWNVDFLQEFASDVAHRRWWKVHDAMPEELQGYCSLRSKQKAALEWDRRQAEKGNYTDGHWKRKIRDKRLKVCSEEFCYWESMLWHWGETNWTDTTTSRSNPTTTPKHEKKQRTSHAKLNKRKHHHL